MKFEASYIFIIAAAPPSSAPIITAPVARAASPTVTTGRVDVGRPVPLGPGPVWLPRLVLLDSEGLTLTIGVVWGWVWLGCLGVSFDDSFGGCVDGVGGGWTMVCVDPGRDSVMVLVVSCPGCVTVVGCGRSVTVEGFGCGGGGCGGCCVGFGGTSSVKVTVTVWPTVTVRVWPWLVSTEMIVFVVTDVFSFGGLGLSVPLYGGVKTGGVKTGGVKQSSLCRRHRLSDGDRAPPSGPTEAGAGVGTGSAGA